MARIILVAFLLATLVAASWLPLAECAERVTCYNSGRKFTRARIINAINSFCSRYKGQTFANGRKVNERYDFPSPETGHIDISAEAFRGCSFRMDENECGRLLRRPTDECNTGGENGKQGGYVQDDCRKFKMDPNA
ncbi:hypothetical protein Mapa_017090 [Marchantia paleacea]|nr:hypothetical protein Mapa_017090 [Marchantia paleacea]